MCDCCEEKKRKERERARRAAERAAAFDEDGYGGGPGGPPPPRFTPVQVVLGSTGFLFGLLALLLKFMDNDTAHAMLSKIGLGHLIPKKKRGHCVTINQKKRKWPVDGKSKED